MKHFFRTVSLALTVSVAGLAAAGQGDNQDRGNSRGYKQDRPLTKEEQKRDRKLVKGHNHDVPEVQAAPPAPAAAAADLNNRAAAAVRDAQNKRNDRWASARRP
ncbi:MAG: hypothetical protein JWQ13_3102, partial [Ramlibacter sp.]|nr:hypothetical protein [Ramlibacter sp.]